MCRAPGAPFRTGQCELSSPESLTSRVVPVSSVLTGRALANRDSTARTGTLLRALKRAARHRPQRGVTSSFTGIPPLLDRQRSSNASCVWPASRASAASSAIPHSGRRVRCTLPIWA